MTDDDLVVPHFLRRVRGDKPMPRGARWKKTKAERPEGAFWEHAERWEVTVPAPWSDKDDAQKRLASGRRYVWVVTGRKWAYIRDAERKLRVPVADWYRAAKRGRRVVSC